MLLPLAVALGLGAGCAPPPAVHVGIAPSALAAHVARLGDVRGGEADLGRRLRYAAEQMAGARLQPALWGSFLVPHAAGGGHAVGLLAGADARAGSQLVLVSADLDDPIAAAALLEVGRVLEAERRLGRLLGSSVAVALWSPPRTGALGAGDFLARPLWSPPAIAEVIHVSGDAGRAGPVRAAWEAAGVPFRAIVPHAPQAGAPIGDTDTRTAYQLAHMALAAAKSAMIRGADGPIARL